MVRARAYLRRAATLVTVAVLLAASMAAGKEKTGKEPDWSGTYPIIEGKPAQGEAYTGTLEVKKKAWVGSKKRGWPLWTLIWRRSGREQPIEGIAMMWNSALLVAAGAGADYGIGIYEKTQRGERDEWMRPDDNLRGYWFDSRGSMGQEGLRGSREAWEGEYRLHGISADGGHPYVGNLTVNKKGEILEMRYAGKFTKGIDKAFDYPGLALELPGMLLSAWSGSGGTMVGAYTVDEGKIIGVLADETGMGTEKIEIPPEIFERLSAWARSD